MAAYTGTNSFDKDSLRTTGLPWQPCTIQWRSTKTISGPAKECTRKARDFLKLINIQITFVNRSFLSVDYILRFNGMFRAIDLEQNVVTQLCDAPAAILHCSHIRLHMLWYISSPLELVLCTNVGRV